MNRLEEGESQRVNPSPLNSFNYKMTTAEAAKAAKEAKAAADKIICVAIYLSGLRGVIATTGRKITSGREGWWSAPLRAVGCSLAASTNGQVAVLVRGRSVGGAGSVVH